MGSMAGYTDASSAVRPGRWNKRAKRELIAGLLFSAPWLIGLIVIIIYPMLTTLYYSFTRYDIPLAPRWIGLKNYIDLFTADRFFPKVLFNSAFLTLIGIPAQLALALACAMLLNIKIRGQAIWRTVYILPTLMPPVALALLWRWMLNPELGLVNNALRSIGISGPLWFADPLWSKPSIILMQLWAVGAMTVIYLAALQGVPYELYEAAEIDGAGRLQRFWNITLPMISPVTLFQLITGVIWSLQFFTEAYIIGGVGSNPGAPEGSLLFYGLYLYVQGFQYLNMGYASAMAWILFVVTALVTWLLLRGLRRWTFYDVM
jgi:multiple sugar transport system permease protein